MFDDTRVQLKSVQIRSRQQSIVLKWSASYCTIGFDKQYTINVRSRESKMKILILGLICLQTGITVGERKHLWLNSIHVFHIHMGP